MNTISKSTPSTGSSSDIKGLRGTSAGNLQGNTGSVANSNAVRQTASITGNMILASMQPGSTFSGDIIDVRGHAIKILMANDKTLEAASTDSKNLNIGDHITFNVASNDGKTVVIKPLKVNTFNTNVLLKALEAAEVPANEKNVGIVKAMMQNEMSIDKNSLSEMIKKVDSFKTETPEDIVAMERHGIPLTQENVEQFSEYKNYEHRIMAQAETVSKEIPEMLKNMLETGNNSKTSEVAIKLLNILSENGIDGMTLSNNLDGMVMIRGNRLEESLIGNETQDSIDNEQLQDISLSNEDEAYLNKLGITDDSLSVTIESSNMAESKVRLTNEQVIDNLNNLKGAELKEFLDSPEFKAFVKDKVSKVFELNVNRLGTDGDEVKDKVKKLYKNIDNKTEAILNLLEQSGQKDTILGQTANNMRNNLQFMQDLSQMAAYVQLPIKLNESKAHGELYVFNRKNGKAVDKDVVTAFLHLDLENLGATEINVTLEKKALRTEFSISDDLSLKIVEEHLNELKERLDKRGFSTTITAKKAMLDSDKSAFDKVLENDKPQISIKRFSFDVRA